MIVVCTVGCTVLFKTQHFVIVSIREYKRKDCLKNKLFLPHMSLAVFIGRSESAFDRLLYGRVSFIVFLYRRCTSQKTGLFSNSQFVIYCSIKIVCVHRHPDAKVSCSNQNPYVPSILCSKSIVCQTEILIYST